MGKQRTMRSKAEHEARQPTNMTYARIVIAGMHRYQRPSFVPFVLYGRGHSLYVEKACATVRRYLDFARGFPPLGSPTLSSLLLEAIPCRFEF